MGEHQPRQQLVGRHERGVLHSERAEDVLLAVGVQVLAADRFDHQPEPVDARSVLPPRAGVGDQRRLEHLAAARRWIGKAGQLVVAQQVGIAEPVRKARGVSQQVADRRLAGGRPQSRLIAVEPLEHLELAELGQDVGHRLLERHPTLLDQLQPCCARERLRHRCDQKHRVELRRALVLDAEAAERPLVQTPVTVPRDGNDARHRAAIHRSLQQPVDVARVHVRPPEGAVACGNPNRRAAPVAGASLRLRASCP